VLPLFSYIDLIICILFRLSSHSVLMNIDSVKPVINFVINRCFRVADTGQRSGSGQRRSACHTHMRRNLTSYFHATFRTHNLQFQLDLSVYLSLISS